MTLIKCVDLKKIYNPKTNPIYALDGVSFTIEKGEFVAIIGASGSGKSTLLNTLGLLDYPSSGQYFLNDLEITRLKETNATSIRLKNFGFIFQSFNLMNNISCLKNVELSMLYNGVKAKERKTRALELLAKMGIQDQAYKKPMTLSGGQRQRVAIARALANNPDVIFADEPTGALDSKTTENILNLLKQLHQQGNTIIIVTHDLNVAQTAQRIITIKDGKIESDVMNKWF